MNCPICEGDTKVVDSRSECDLVVRYRKCKSCGHKLYTLELESDEANKIYREIHRKMAFCRSKERN